jgi:MFS family permease
MGKKIFYGWWIVLATNVICLLGFGTWLYSFGVFFKPMMVEFGWTRAMTAGAASLRSVEGGVAGPVVGWAVDRYGSRIVILTGAVISGLGFSLMPFVDSLLGFYLIYGLLVSIGMSAMLYIPAFTVIAKWFSRRLSFALAVLAMGAGFGGLICAPAAAIVIKHFGWRTAFLAIGILIWVVVIPLALVVRERPEDMGLSPDGVPPKEKGPKTPGVQPELDGPSRAADYTLKQALASSAFWLLAASWFYQSMVHSIVFVHAVPHLTDVGISVEKAAFSVGLLTLVSVAGRLSFGYLGDLIDKRYLFMIAYSLMGSGVLVLMNAESMPMVYLFIGLFGFGFGCTVPLMPAIRAEYFGRTALGKIQGFMTPVTMIAGAIGPVAAGHLFDTTGSYRIAFLLAGLSASLAITAIFFARPGRRPTRVVAR